MREVTITSTSKEFLRILLEKSIFLRAALGSCSIV